MAAGMLSFPGPRAREERAIGVVCAYIWLAEREPGIAQAFRNEFGTDRDLWNEVCEHLTAVALGLGATERALQAARATQP